MEIVKAANAEQGAMQKTKAHELQKQHVVQQHSVRTYVNHVKNICHSELAYPLTKRTLLVIG